MSVIKPVSGVSGATTPPSRQATPKVSDRQPTPASAAGINAPKRRVEPIRYFGGLDGMNATNLIVALQTNGAISGGYSAQAIETGGTLPPAIVDKGA